MSKENEYAGEEELDTLNSIHREGIVIADRISDLAEWACGCLSFFTDDKDACRRFALEVVLRGMAPADAIRDMRGQGQSELPQCRRDDG